MNASSNEEEKAMISPDDITLLSDKREASLDLQSEIDQSVNLSQREPLIETPTKPKDAPI